MKSPRRDFVVLWVLVVLGAVLDIELLLHRRSAEAGSLPGCSLTGFQCEDVLSSPYGRVLGFSLAWWGLAYYSALGFGLVIASWLPELLARLSLAVATVPGAASAVWLIAIMQTQIGSYCLWCLALHAVNIGLLSAAIYQCRAAWNRQRTVAMRDSVPSASGRLLLASLIAGSVLAIWQVTVLALFHDPVGMFTTPVAGHPAPMNELSIAADEHPSATVLGNPKSPQQIVIFSCLTCTECRRVHRMLTGVQRRTGHLYRIELRFAPLSPECNPVYGAATSVSPEHQHACSLARLSLAVAIANESQFAEYVEWLFHHQKGLTPPEAQQEAERLCGAAQLKKAAASLEIDERLARDVELARQFNVDSVPQIFVAGGQLTGTLTKRGLQDVLAMP